MPTSFFTRFPAGSATIVGSVDVNISDASGDAIELGQTTMSASLPVAIASDQTAVPVTEGGLTLQDSVVNDYSSTNVTTGAWVELIASTSGDVVTLDIFDSSGRILELGVGAAASEARVLVIFPGGNGVVPLSIASGSRVSIRAVDASATTGYALINLLG